ncbi:hypothetical protein BU14_0442s0021 [Porphyra umbilicalis]|uniref:Uncharacterized protein n=1 Tax=Porphyra umbilicalis TaxID=2786 RepID=A0A1X6NV45_PORUM|nr:hypothetical protein BU14_0442s0021 [Porphyra umbilicalis]|eukprot:OSX72386.1 hypothetical protein BU14_0442s0021 [Porphyra umbilicalis]
MYKRRCCARPWPAVQAAILYKRPLCTTIDQPHRHPPAIPFPPLSPKSRRQHERPLPPARGHRVLHRRLEAGQTRRLKHLEHRHAHDERPRQRVVPVGHQPGAADAGPNGPKPPRVRVEVGGGRARPPAHRGVHARQPEEGNVGGTRVPRGHLPVDNADDRPGVGTATVGDCAAVAEKEVVGPTVPIDHRCKGRRPLRCSRGRHPLGRIEVDAPCPARRRQPRRRVVKETRHRRRAASGHVGGAAHPRGRPPPAAVVPPATQRRVNVRVQAPERRRGGERRTRRQAVGKR